MKYTHAGVEIELVESTGTFRATVGGERVSAPSLAGIKTKIDKANKFPQFTALVDKGEWHDKQGKGRYVEVAIVGIKRAKASAYRGADFWITSAGEQLNEVFENTDKSKEALLAYDKMIARHKVEKIELDDRQRAERKEADNALKRHAFPAAK